MNSSAVQFAAILFRGDTALMEGAREALAQPAAFHARYGSELGYVRSRRDTPYVPDEWTVLRDFAQLHNWVWVVDWKEAADEVTAAVKSLVPAQPLAVDWVKTEEAGDLLELDTEKYLQLLARTIRPTGERLVSLDDGSDSYSLALIPATDLAQAMQLAVAIGKGKVAPLDDL